MMMSGEKKESESGGLRKRLQSTLMVKIDFHQLTLQVTVYVHLASFIEFPQILYKFHFRGSIDARQDLQ